MTPDRPGSADGPSDAGTAAQRAPADALRERLQVVAALLAGMPAQERPGPRLAWCDTAGAVQVRTLADGDVLGRGSGCALVIDEPKLSRRHCRFRTGRAPGEWTVEDLRSTNGTLVNGRNVATASLLDGDVLTLGATDIVFLR